MGSSWLTRTFHEENKDTYCDLPSTFVLDECAFKSRFICPKVASREVKGLLTWWAIVSSTHFLTYLPLHVMKSWRWCRLMVEKCTGRSRISTQNKVFEATTCMTNTMEFFKKNKNLKLEFSGGQVSCPRVWGCPRNVNLCITSLAKSVVVVANHVIFSIHVWEFSTREVFGVV